MGLPAQLTRRARPGAAAPRRGAALPTALFGLVVVSVLATAIFSSIRTQSQATRNRESATRAIQLADNGMTHALILLGDTLKGYPFNWLLKGSDNVADNGDDGVLSGYILSTNVNIPSTGRIASAGRYRVQVIDDPADGDVDVKSDRNLKVIVRCTATLDDGGSASVDAVISQVVLPAIAADGNMIVGTQAQVLGQCGALHANGNLTLPSAGSNFPTISGTLTASGSTSGTARDTLFATKTPVSGAPAVAIPDLDPPDFCPAGAEWILRADGYLRRVSTNTTYNANGTPHFGWTYTATTSPARTWTLAGPAAVPGKVCADGNVAITGNSGTAAAPLAITIVATGSVGVSGTPYLTPATSDSVLIVAGGDISLAGNSSGSASNYEGLVYAENQCVVTGSPRMAAQVLCKNKPATVVSTVMTPIAGAPPTFTVTEYAATTNIGGSAIIQYRCGGVLAKRRVNSWLQRVL